MKVLGVETACDDTSVAIVEDGELVLSNIVWSQDLIHQDYGGVVPELAARRHAEVTTLVIDEALKKANVSIKDINAVAVNSKHGLLRSVAVGVASAKALAYACGVPIVGVHHIEGHIYSAKLTNQKLQFPHLCLAVSGGHNLLILVSSIGDYKIVGKTLDDTAGEAFDKVAKELGLGFPGGLNIDKISKYGDKNRYSFPRPMLQSKNYNFSFSGLKTPVKNVINLLEKTQLEELKSDIAASFQQAVIDVLIAKTIKAAIDLGVPYITVVGGVAANSLLREELAFVADRHSLNVVFADKQYCTDNAAMIAGVGFHKLRLGEYSNMTLDATPNAPLGNQKEEYK